MGKFSLGILAVTGLVTGGTCIASKVINRKANKVESEAAAVKVESEAAAVCTELPDIPKGGDQAIKKRFRGNTVVIENGTLVPNDAERYKKYLEAKQWRQAEDIANTLIWAFPVGAVLLFLHLQWLTFKIGGRK